MRRTIFIEVLRHREPGQSGHATLEAFAQLDGAFLSRGNVTHRIWEHKFMRTTFTIELRMDVENEEGLDLMTQVIKDNAKNMFSQAVLLGGKKTPVINVRSSNSLIGDNDIGLLEETDGTT